MFQKIKKRVKIKTRLIDHEYNRVEVMKEDKAEESRRRKAQSGASSEKPISTLDLNRDRGPLLNCR